MEKLEAEFEPVLRGRPGVFDGGGVDCGCMLGNECPVGFGYLVVWVDFDMTIGDAA